jgi:hypothetical protein
MDTCNRPENSPQNEKVQLIAEILKLMYGLYFNKKNLLPFRRHSADLYIPGVFFFISSLVFLLSYRVFPLFEEPRRSMDVTRMIRGGSEYFTSHSLENLVSQFYFVIISILVGATVICLLIKALGGAFDEIVYMLGVTAAAFSIILLFLLLNFGCKLFIIKLVQRHCLPPWVTEYCIPRVSAGQLILLLVFLVLPIMKVHAIVWKQFRMRGIICLNPMIVLLFIGVWLMRHYSEPVRSQNHVHNKDQHKPDSLNKKSIVVPIDSGTLAKKPVPDTANSTIQRSAAHIPKSFVIDSQVVLSPVKHDTVMRFYTGVCKHHYFMRIVVAVTNRSDKVLEFPYYKALQINFAVDRIGLRQQYGHFSKDFTFNIERTGVMKAESVCIPPGRSQIFCLRKDISVRTYMYLRDYLRQHADRPRTAVFILAMRDKLTKHSIDVKPVYPWAIQFGWNEAYGFDVEYAYEKSTKVLLNSAFYFANHFCAYLSY